MLSPNLIRWLAIILVSCTSTAMALQQRHAHNNGSISANMATSGLTRIFIKDDRITHVRGLSGAYTFVNDTEQGEVYLKPTKRLSRKPVHVFITTEQGRTFTVTLTPKHGASQSIEIIPLDSTPQTNTAKQQAKNNRVSQLIDFVQGVLTHNNALSHQLIDHQHQAQYRLGDIARITSRETVHGEHFTAEIDTIKNITQKLIIINESEFYTPGTLAVVLDRTEISGGNRATAYRIFQQPQGE